MAPRRLSGRVRPPLHLGRTTPTAATSTPTTTSCSARRSRPSCSWAARPPRCSSAACGSGYTRAGRLIDMLERRGVISGLRGLEGPPGADHRGRPAAHPRGAWTSLQAFLPTPRRSTAIIPGNAGNRRNAPRGAHAPEGQHRGSRAVHEDPREVPACARERGVRPAARARPTSRASCARMRRSSASTRRSWWRSSAPSTSSPSRSSSSRSVGAGRDRRRRPPTPRFGPGAAIAVAVVALLGFLLVLG